MTHTFKEGDAQLGSFYPKNCIVAVMPEASSAHKAARELLDHGFAQDELHVWTAHELFGDQETFTDDRNVLQKVGAVFSDEEIWMNEYREYAAKGQPLLTVYAETDDRVQAAQPILEQFGAGKMRYYGNTMAVRDLVKGKAPDYDY